MPKPLVAGRAVTTPKPHRNCARKRLWRWWDGCKVSRANTDPDRAGTDIERCSSPLNLFISGPRVFATAEDGIWTRLYNKCATGATS